MEVINETVFCHLTDGVVPEMNGALAGFEETFLNRPDFVKTHRSYLVNLNCVQAMDANYVVTKNGHRILIARLRHKQVQDHYVLPASGRHDCFCVWCTQRRGNSKERKKIPKDPGAFYW